jgi:hypothetical protein
MGGRGLSGRRPLRLWGLGRGRPTCARRSKRYLKHVIEVTVYVMGPLFLGLPFVLASCVADFGAGEIPHGSGTGYARAAPKEATDFGERHDGNGRSPTTQGSGPDGQCTSDGQCPSGHECWVEIPRGPGLGIRGSLDNPGRCWSKSTLRSTY